MRFLMLFVSLSFPIWSVAQTVCSQASSERLDAMLTQLAQKDFAQSSMQATIIEIGKRFLNTPYVEKTLEVEGDEPLVINLVGLDCTTYLESIVTLSRLAKLGRLTRADYEKELAFLRYRNGIRDSYPSRLHYFSDWIYNNQEKGILRDITEEIGGVPYPNAPSFMSSHPQYYPQLANKAFIPQIQESEAEIKDRAYYYIPKASVQKLEHNIQSGDLIAITISMNNLDISHVGIAVEQNGRIHLMHASSSAKKVVISPSPLSDYLQSNKSQSGIMVCRFQSPE